VWCFNAPNQKSPQILAAIQYASTPVGSWINWLGVSGAIPAMFLSEDGTPRTFRGLGLGMFLQVLVQFQQLYRGWNPRLFLQTLLSGDACLYYLKRGYHRAPSNAITSIPDIEHSPFTTHHVHIMTDEFQMVEGTLPQDFVSLHFINGFVITTFLGDGHSFFFLDGEVMDAYPKNEDNLMVQFPYNTVGQHMEKCLFGDGSFRLLTNPIFSPPGSAYVLPDCSAGGPMNKDIVRSDNAYARKFDKGNVTRLEYTELRDDPTVFVTDGTIGLFGTWMLRNPNMDLNSDVAIIPPSLADLLRQLFYRVGVDYEYRHYFNGEMETTLGNIDKYLYGHPDILEKRLIFFICNVQKTHWFGLCAVNAWKAIIKEHKRKKTKGLHADFQKPNCERFEDTTIKGTTDINYQ
jgi:hypothetical protein